MKIGLDFGTTNSGTAAYDGRRVHLFPVDPAGQPPTIIRSALYITRDHQVHIGRQAIDTYYRQNSGRPRKLVKKYTGTLSQVYSDGLEVVEDIYAHVDELSPGRLLRSLKSALSGRYEGTEIFGKTYELEELVALYLGEIRRRVEVKTGERVDGVVLGRPVNFVGSDDTDGSNARAQTRLLEAAKRAGFGQVQFELEPVAAALHYELSIREPQNIVVFDFGGGTLDITVLQVGRPGERKVYATGGVGIAGELFDRRIVASLLLDHFGQGSTWGDESVPFPSQHTQALLNWQTILELYRPEVLHFFRSAQMSGSHPARVRALESLVTNDEGIHLFDIVEGAKVDLSTACFAIIRLLGQELDIWQPITRTQFEALIGDETRQIERCLLDTVEASSLELEQIDAVVRTGGSAQIPAFITMLENLFGREKVVLSEVFSGVTAGLAVRAAEMEECG